jgi:IS5 family transposase
LPLEVETPDRASIWRFRRTIEKLGLSAALLAETNRQLNALGLIVKRGRLVDATLIPDRRPVKKPPYGSGGVNPRDPDTRVTLKRKKAHFGTKAHLAVDEGSGLVRQAEMTSANVHDFCPAEALIQGDEQGYFVDKAYSSQAFREALERRGLVDGVAWRGRPHHPLEDWQRLHNSWSLSIHCGVEHAHATMKQGYGMSPALRPRPQRLPSSLCRRRHEHETRPRAHGEGLIHRAGAIRANDERPRHPLASGGQAASVQTQSQSNQPPPTTYAQRPAKPLILRSSLSR